MRTITFFALCCVAGCIPVNDSKPTADAVAKADIQPVPPAPAPAVAKAPAAPVAPPVPVAECRDDLLWREYGENALSADLKYKDKYVILTGILRDVSSEDGRYYLGLAPLMTQFGYIDKRRDILPSVVCFLAPDAAADFANYREESNVKVIARVVGRKSANAPKGYIVILEDARLSK